VALLDALVATGTPVVVVLVQSKPSVLPPSALSAAALIEAFNPGMRGGRAIADLILGLIEPTGRLPLSVPRHVGQQPTYYNQIRGQHGDRYADLTAEPLFVFGDGLSYGSVEYSALTVLDDVVPADGVVRAEVTVTNTAARPALETIQVYVADQVTSVTWAVRELKGYRQVEVPAGESAGSHSRSPRRPAPSSTPTRTGWWSPGASTCSSAPARASPTCRSPSSPSRPPRAGRSRRVRGRPRQRSPGLTRQGQFRRRGRATVESGIPALQQTSRRRSGAVKPFSNCERA
jgi:beta-glucosidase